MNFINNISKQTIIICSNGNKIKLLKKLNFINKIIPVNFLSLNELYNSMYFSYDKNTIYNIMKKFNIKYDVALCYLNNLRYINDKKYGIDKLDYLVDIKKYLDSENLLIKDEYFIEFIKGKDILFYGFNYIDKFMYKAIDELKKITSVKIINKDNNKFKHSVYEFKHIEDEVEYVADKICDLIKNNIDINKIKLCNINDEYIPSIKRIFNMYNLPILLDDNNYISSTLTGKYFIDNYENDLNITIGKLKSKYNNDIVSQIINVINEYTFVNDKILVKDMIIYDLNNKKVNYKKYENYIEIIDYNDVVDDDEYVFMMNFNLGAIPKIIKDEKYLNNNDLLLLELNTNVELSKMIKESTIDIIYSIKNLFISYKSESYTNEYFPSNLISDMNLHVEHKDISCTYSNIANEVRLCRYLDSYYKYNIVNNNLERLFNNYKVDYRTYDNSYKRISFESLNKVLNNKLNLSYSSMQSYNECSFKYYINNILKLDVYKDTFSAFIGTLFHYILEIGIKNNISVKDEVNNYIKDKILSNKEKYYVDKIINDIEFALNTIKDNLKYTKLLNIKTENKFEIVKNGDITITFKGFIDKMMSYNDGIKTYVAIIDYKTYNSDIKMNLIDYGINLQLPIYLYLSSKNLNDVVFVGFYLQNVLPEDNKYDINNSLFDRKKDSMKLNGYSNSNEDILKLFDSSYASSNIIRGLKLKNDGEFVKTANVLTNEQMNEVINKTELSIDKCIDNIEKSNFDINPKCINNINIGCRYCKYNDICFMTEKDIVNIETEEGEENDEMD